MITQARYQSLLTLLEKHLLSKIKTPNPTEFWDNRILKLLKLWKLFNAVYGSRLVRKKLRTYLNQINAINQHIYENGRPDLVIGLQSIEDSGIFAWLIHELYGTPFVVWEHTTPLQRGLIKPKTQRWQIMYECIQQSTYICPVSRQLRE